MAGKGGVRSTSFKPKWKLGETKAIRVPVVLADQFLAVAKELDEKELTDLKRASLLAIIQSMDEFVESLQGISGGNQYKRKGEVKTSGERWYFFNKFKKQVESMLLEEEKQENE